MSAALQPTAPAVVCTATLTTTRYFLACSWAHVFHPLLSPPRPAKERKSCGSPQPVLADKATLHCQLPQPGGTPLAGLLQSENLSACVKLMLRRWLEGCKQKGYPGQDHLGACSWKAACWGTAGSRVLQRQRPMLEGVAARQRRTGS